MKAIETLKKVVELAEKRRDEALAALTRVQRELQAAQEQMKQLQSYADEAVQRWAVRSSVGVDTTLLHHHSAFMQRIEHAMDFQHGVLSNRQGLVERAQQQVQAAERDVAGLRKYTERQLQALLQLAQRQEQKDSDELALAIHLRQSQLQSHTKSARP
ncbi:flagellar export protein FliJ [Hydrogenophaga sp.]|uniref:flagellar export protein FliJ n=1 Tax=Hydrogenophaga sp. TaxID=1904254 RepID=UPI0019B6C109|nr:flagellar export protein FliJ [Hydrogenophaga sp.]MBD3894206.1 flagellar export protein FliJ [Hydrogenophaga sp.]